jgi:AcrR family transcriptional regulator
MPARRLRRDELVVRNRDRLLAAARAVFLERGFHGATLDAIAEEAGFSKGVVYSQFESKADLFLTLLEARIEERAEQNERIARAQGGSAALTALVSLAERAEEAEPAWTLLLLEFRAHAARESALNERYARLHGRTVERLAGLLARVLAEEPGDPIGPPQLLAELVLAVGAGSALERFVRPGALPPRTLAHLLIRAAGIAAPPPVAARTRAAARGRSAAPRRAPRSKEPA